MNKQELINKCKNEEDKLLVSKILDKIKLAKNVKIMYESVLEKKR